MSETKAIIEGETVIAKLASSFPEQEQKRMMRDVILVTQIKTTGQGDNKRVLNVYEGFTQVMTCDALGLNPLLDHILFLDGKPYITLAGHLHNAHRNGLLGIDTEVVGDVMVKVKQRNWDKKIDEFVEVRQFKYKCTVTRMVGGERATFTAYGIADVSNVAGGAKNNDIKIEQMAEARAMRRALSRSFPVGLSHYEDAIEGSEIGVALHPIDPKLEAPETNSVSNKLRSAKKTKPEAKPETVVEATVTEEPAINAETLSQVAHEEAKPLEGQTEIPAQEPVMAEPVEEPVTEATIEEVFGEEPEQPLAPGLDQIARIEELCEEISAITSVEVEKPVPTNREEAATAIRTLIERLNAAKNPPTGDDEAKKNARDAFQKLRGELRELIDADTKFKSANGGKEDPTISRNKALVTQKIIDARNAFKNIYGEDISGS